MILFLLMTLIQVSPSFAGDDQNQHLKTLFSKPFTSPDAYPAHTFVILNHGAADHHAAVSSQNLDENAPWGDADAHDNEMIKTLATQCDSCNVVLLHTQLEGARWWYLRKHPYAAYLRVYSGKKKLLSRHVDVINAADPRTVTFLLKFAQRGFPKSYIHFVYRGHAFYPGYTPGVEGDPVLPFDYNYRKDFYGLDVFKKSVQDAHVLLGSISLAACHMGVDPVYNELYTLTPNVIATSIPRFPNAFDKGYSYRFLTLTQDEFTPGEVADTIRSTLFEKGPWTSEFGLRGPGT